MPDAVGELRALERLVDVCADPRAARVIERVVETDRRRDREGFIARLCAELRRARSVDASTREDGGARARRSAEVRETTTCPGCGGETSARRFARHLTRCRRERAEAEAEAS